MLRAIGLALLLTTVLALPALAQDRRDDRQQMRQQMTDHWQGMNGTARDHLLLRAERHGLFARLDFTPDPGSTTSGMAMGRFLAFHVQGDAGAIHNVRVHANRTWALSPLFAAVTPAPFTLQSGPAVHGAVLTLDGTSLELMAHNNPTAGLTWHAANATTLTFTLAPGLHAFRPDATETREVRVLVGATHAHIATDGAAGVQLSNDNTTVTISLAAGDAVMVRVHPAGDPAGGGLHDLLAAFRARKLGASLRVADDNGTAAADGEASDVNAAAREVGHGHATFDISSMQHAGRVLFLTVDNDTVDPARLDQVTVTLDGAPVRNAATPAAVVAASDAAFALVPSADHATVTVAVSVPHFSSYALALAQPVASAGGSPSSAGAASSASGAGGAAGGSTTRGAPGFEAGALLVAALGAALLLRRRA